MSLARVRVLPLALGAAAIAVLIALGVWQVQRRAWKLDLIARVEHRLNAAPVAAPAPPRWRQIGKDDAYTRVVATGRFRIGADTYTQATTELGAGYWVITPLDTGGWTVLVNRGFVPARERGRHPAPAGEQRVTGLLRVTEPGGGFLRHNDPAADRWYSRDVVAIAAKRGLVRVAPYFIDADARAGEPVRSDWPRGGLTVVRFPNNHLVYALTWFGLAALVAVLLARALRTDRRDD
ncbi:SURF1 family protein [Sphingomonas sp. RHCKR47]|uniref:SURF1 family protein n=1 Tax=Sphingomonas citricola TaxID=2862498 RepID=UPI001CA5ED70|nr:SURF1 family protein [Sphingomonas citricola]MBW6523860.1 SURF1 family protein [Sphingomonas citricola]